MVKRLKKIRGKKRRFNNLERDIPKGQYCYTWNPDGTTTNCPYWDVDETVEDKQNNGICTLFKMRDSDYYGLLWDQVKECNVNDEYLD